MYIETSKAANLNFTKLEALHSFPQEMFPSSKEGFNKSISYRKK